MQELDLHEMLFQEDGVTCHTARITMDLLTGEFGQHFISRLGPVSWLPRLHELTTLDYFLWGYVKADTFEDKFEAFIREISAKVLERLRQNWTKRMDHVRHSFGQHLHEIILKH